MSFSFQPSFEITYQVCFAEKGKLGFQAFGNETTSDEAKRELEEVSEHPDFEHCDFRIRQKTVLISWIR